MAKFAYQGVQGHSRRSGEIDASDRRAALAGLRQMGIVPIQVMEAQAGTAAAGCDGASADSGGGAS